MTSTLHFLPVRSASDLKYNVELSGLNPHYFTRTNMKFVGDTMRNYGVRRATVTRASDGQQYECWELYRRRPVKHGNQASAYFCRSTFERIHPAA